MNAQDVIRILDLQPLDQEGGLFRETYRCPEGVDGSCLPARYRGEGRSFCTAIYYLLEANTFSAIHRVASDEMFHFYLGDPVTMLQLRPDGSSERIVLGVDLLAGQRPQCVVRRGVWQGLMLSPGGSFALMGTTVAPGFEYADFELGERGALLRAYPGEAEMIRRLTRE